MDVYDFCYRCTDDCWIVAIYDMRTEEEVFHGSMRDAMDSDFAFCDVLSFDLVPAFEDSDVAVILNIETEEDE